MDAREQYLLIVYAPVGAADAVRAAIADAGGGRIGNYRGCSFSVRGLGRFTPDTDSDPAIGKPNDPTVTEEERMEVLVPAENVTAIVRAIRAVHPYEEPAINVLPCMTIE